MLKWVFCNGRQLRGLLLRRTDEDILRRARSVGYDGEIVLGADRMVLEVGDELRVQTPPPLDALQDVTRRGQG